MYDSSLAIKSSAESLTTTIRLLSSDMNPCARLLSMSELNSDHEVFRVRAHLAHVCGARRGQATRVQKRAKLRAGRTGKVTARCLTK